MLESLRLILELLAQTLDARDPYTASHSARVSELAGRLGKDLDLSSRDVELLRAAGSLHDLGKIGIRDEILLKPGPLTEEELAIFRRHPDIGADIIAQHPALAELAPLVRHHHEHWDGTGYPAGLKGAAIPLGARIIEVADLFDGLTSSSRPWFRPMSVDAALKEIRERFGPWHDPAIVAALRAEYRFN